MSFNLSITRSKQSKVGLMFSLPGRSVSLMSTLYWKVSTGWSSKITVCIRGFGQAWLWWFRFRLEPKSDDDRELPQKLLLTLKVVKSDKRNLIYFYQCSYFYQCLVKIPDRLCRNNNVLQVQKDNGIFVYNFYQKTNSKCQLVSQYILGNLLKLTKKPFSLCKIFCGLFQYLRWRSEEKSILWAYIVCVCSSRSRVNPSKLFSTLISTWNFPVFVVKLGHFI